MASRVGGGDLPRKGPTALEPYDLQPQDVATARKQLKSYLAMRVHAIHQEPDIEGVPLEGAYGEYLKAVQANEAANRRHELALKQARDHDLRPKMQLKSENEATSADLLKRHIELTRLQKEHGRLVVLRDEFETFKLSRNLPHLEIESTHSESLLKPADYGSEITSLADSIRQQLKTLEIAVIQAQNEATRQKATLDSLKAQSDDIPTPTAQQRVASMFLTKSQLTAWLEESLEKCQGDDRFGDQESIDRADEYDNVDTEDKIEEQYERYLQARKRVLSAVSALKSDAPEAGANAASGAVRTEQPPVQPQKSGMDSILNFIERSLLSTMQQQNITRTHSEFADEQLANANASVVKVVDRLSDESQLLQAFPMLANSGRFQHATSVFGNKLNGDAEVQDEISRGIEPWLFSAEAADVAAKSTIDKYVKQGREAMESVSRSLTELRLLREVNDALTFPR